MPGIHALLGQNHFHSRDLKILEIDKRLKASLFFEDKKAKLAICTHAHYPIETYQFDSIRVVFEGMIYNFSDSQIKNKLYKIAKSFIKNGAYLKLIADFVEIADGEFLIEVLEPGQKYLVFNDIQGRLPLYYYTDDLRVIVSKEFQFLLQYLPQIRFDQSSLVEYLMYEYPFGEKTIFEDIRRLMPATYLLIDLSQKNMHFSSGKNSKFHFNQNQKFQTKAQSIIYLKKVYLEAVNNRVKTVRRKGYDIIADLSGGFDTRAVLGGLSIFDRQVRYHTYEYILDESKVAGELFKKMGSPGIYQKLSGKNVFTFSGIEDLIYHTNGLVNYFTTSVCSRDTEILSEHSPAKAVRFGGLNGEWIRHPYTTKHRHFLAAIKNNFYSWMTTKEACGAVRLDLKNYNLSLETYFDSYEKQSEAQVKHLYFEYYNNYVGQAAEERERIYYWLIHPFWSLEMSRAMYHDIPLNWVGYEYFTSFLKSLDAKLLSVSIYGKKIDLNSRRSLRFFDQKNRIHQLNLIAIAFIKKYFYFFVKILMRARADKSQWRLKRKYYNKLKVTRALFAPDIINRDIYGLNAQRLITLFIYLAEIEKRYIHKIKI